MKEEMEIRKCEVDSCSNKFKVLKSSKKKTCSSYCEQTIRGWIYAGRIRIRKNRKSLDSIDSEI